MPRRKIHVIRTGYGLIEIFFDPEHNEYIVRKEASNDNERTEYFTSSKEAAYSMAEKFAFDFIHAREKDNE